MSVQPRTPVIAQADALPEAVHHGLRSDVRPLIRDPKGQPLPPTTVSPGQQGRAPAQYEIFFNEDESEAVVFERYRDADAAIEHFSNISHLMAPILATASVTGEVLGTPNAKMKEQLGKGEPKLFTPWMALQDQELARED